MTDRLYVYVKDWERFQPRSDRPNLPWLRLHTDLLGNDDWLELSCPDKVLLMTIWVLTQRHGNGRLVADQKWLSGHAVIGWSPRSRNLERLVQAGFITLSTTKAPPSGGLEEKKYLRTSKKRKERGREPRRSTTSSNGDQPHLAEDEQPLTKEEQQRQTREARALISGLPQVKGIDD